MGQQGREVSCQCQQRAWQRWSRHPTGSEEEGPSATGPQISGKAQRICRKRATAWKTSCVRGFAVRKGRGGRKSTSKHDVRKCGEHAARAGA